MQCSHGGRLVGRIEVMNDARSLGRTCTGISGEATNRGIDGRTVLTGGTPKVLFVTPNVRAKRPDAVDGRAWVVQHNRAHHAGPDGRRSGSA